MLGKIKCEFILKELVLVWPNSKTGIHSGFFNVDHLCLPAEGLCVEVFGVPVVDDDNIVMFIEVSLECCLRRVDQGTFVASFVTCIP